MAADPADLVSVESAIRHTLAQMAQDDAVMPALQEHLTMLKERRSAAREAPSCGSLAADLHHGGRGISGSL